MAAQALHATQAGLVVASGSHSHLASACVGDWFRLLRYMVTRVLAVHQPHHKQRHTTLYSRRRFPPCSQVDLALLLIIA